MAEAFYFLQKGYMRYSFLLFCILASCGQKREYIDPSFAKYVQSFNTQYGVDINMNMRFAPQDGSVVAVCISYSNGSNRIEVDPEKWQNYDEDTKEEVIFHELGHCFLDRPHREDVVDYGWRTVPMSIMYPFVMPASTYRQYHSEYMHELVNPDHSFQP